MIGKKLMMAATVSDHEVTVDVLTFHLLLYVT